MIKILLTKAAVTVSQAPATPNCEAEAELSADSDSITISSIYSLSDHKFECTSTIIQLRIMSCYCCAGVKRKRFYEDQNK